MIGFRLNVRAAVKQESGDGGLRVAVRRQVQGSQAFVVFRVSIRASVEQESGDSRLCVERRGPVQWGPPIVVFRVSIRASVEQKSGDGGIRIKGRRLVQRVVASRVNRMNIRSKSEGQRNMDSIRPGRSGEEFFVRLRRLVSPCADPLLALLGLVSLLRSMSKPVLNTPQERPNADSHTWRSFRGAGWGEYNACASDGA